MSKLALWFDLGLGVFLTNVSTKKNLLMDKNQLMSFLTKCFTQSVQLNQCSVGLNSNPNDFTVKTKMMTSYCEKISCLEKHVCLQSYHKKQHSFIFR